MGDSTRRLAVRQDLGKLLLLLLKEIPGEEPKRHRVEREHGVGVLGGGAQRSLARRRLF